MPDYAIVNLLEIEDSVSGRVEGLEGRFGRTPLGARDLGISHWRYAPGREPGRARHREQEEAYIVVAGSGRVPSTTSSATSGPGTSSASRRRWSARPKPGRTAWS